MTTTGPTPYTGKPIQVPAPARNGFGIASFICGLTASIVGLIPILAIPALASAVVGLGLGLANTGRLRRKTASNKWMTILGIGFSVLGIILAIIGIVIVTKAMDKVTTDLNNLPASPASWCHTTNPPQC